MDKDTPRHRVCSVSCDGRLRSAKLPATEPVVDGFRLELEIEVRIGPEFDRRSAGDPSVLSDLVVQIASVITSKPLMPSKSFALCVSRGMPRRTAQATIHASFGAIGLPARCRSASSLP